MRAPLSHVAVFLALGGTAVAAPLLTGDDVKDGSLTAVDVKRGSLARRHVVPAAKLPRGREGPPGAMGPTGPPSQPAPSPPSAHGVQFAFVNGDGTLRGGQSPATQVAHPAVGVYCLTADRHRWVHVTSTSVHEAQRAAVVAYAEGEVPEAPCGDGTTARVTIDAPTTPGLDDGPFLFVARRFSDAT